MVQNNLNIDRRIKFLLYKIKNENATITERNEYVDLLLEGGYIDQIEYKKYKKNLEEKEPNSGIGEALIGIGLAVLVGTLLSKLFKSE